MIKKILGWFVVLCIVVFIVKQPDAAAITVSNIAGGLMGIATSASTFFANLAVKKG